MGDAYQLSAKSWPRRPMSACELGIVRRRARLPLADLMSLLLLPLVLAALGSLVGVAADWLLQSVGLHPARAAQVGCWCFAALGLASDVVLFRILRRGTMLERADLHEGEVELIEVVAHRVVNVGTCRRPAFVFECSDGMLLYIAGPSLCTPETYAAASAGSDDDPRDTLPVGPADEGDAAGRFPCTRFTLVRAPHSGAVVRIETQGQPLALEARARPPGIRVAMLDWRESEVLEGSLG